MSETSKATNIKDAPQKNSAKNNITLQLRNLTKVFHSADSNHTAVDTINLNVEQGEFITILGPSGCGKTTILRLVAGFETPTSGKIILDDQVINNVAANNRPMTMVFQSYALFPHMTVFENIAYGLRIKKLNPLDEKVEIVMQLMNLVGLKDRMPHQLSGGQQQRVALARALVMEPRLLLFDEPLSNLDAKLRIHMRTEIRRLHQRLGITSIYVTHDQAEAMGLSDRIVVMSEGHIEQVGSPTEIYMKPASVFVADFMGQSNFIKSIVLGVAEGKLILDFFGDTIEIPWSGQSFAPKDAVFLIIRPASGKLSTPQNKDISIEGVIQQAEYLGTHVEYKIELREEYVIALVDWNLLSIDNLHKEGDQVTVSFPPEAFHILPQLK